MRGGRGRVLVTGGAGFIGSHLAARLIEEGREVICLDNFFTGSKDNVARLADHPRFELIRHDVTQPIYLEVDRIYNLACPASPVHYQDNPIKTVKTNVLGTINMLGVAKRIGARLLQASTSEVYGDPREHPQKETYWGYVNPVGERSCYDEGKRVAETLVRDYRMKNGVDGRIVRIFNTYGPNMALDDGRVVSNFIVQALRGEEITVYGDGSQTRSFCYVSDMVEGLVRMMDRTEEGSGGWSDPSVEQFWGPANLGNPREFTILELAELVLKMTGAKSRIVKKPLPMDDPRQRKPDISLAKEKLGWRPKMELEEGLEKTIAYFKEKLA